MRSYDEIIQTKSSKISVDEFKLYVKESCPDIKAFDEFNENATKVQKNIEKELKLSKKMIEELNKSLMHKIEKEVFK